MSGDQWSAMGESLTAFSGVGGTWRKRKNYKAQCGLQAGLEEERDEVEAPVRGASEPDEGERLELTRDPERAPATFGGGA